MNGLPIHPPVAANFAERFQVLFLALLVLSVVFGGGVIFLAIYWSVKFRVGTKVHRKRPEHESRGLETILIGVPVILSLVVFIWGFTDFASERTPPPDAIEIFVMGKQWMWHIQHGNGAREMDEMTVPVDRAVRLTMVSQDVIHELFIPAFRIQFQVIPGRYTSQWFIPTKIGRYVFLCNQYCGMDHSRMYGWVNVVSQAAYDQWMQDHARPGSPTTEPLSMAGRDLFQTYSCVSCHGAKDTALAPTLLGVYGSTAKLADGSSETVDDNYIRRCIVTPERQVVAGYTNSMPDYGELDERQLWSLLVYIRTLRTAAQLPTSKATAPALERSR